MTKGGTDKKTIKYFSQLDKDLLHKLYNVYKVDFDFFGYSMDEFSRIWIQYWKKELHILFCSITHTNLGHFSKPGTDLKSAGPDVFKTPPTCTILPSFGWDTLG